MILKTRKESKGKKSGFVEKNFFLDLWKKGKNKTKKKILSPKNEEEKKISTIEETDGFHTKKFFE